MLLLFVLRSVVVSAIRISAGFMIMALHTKTATIMREIPSVDGWQDDHSDDEGKQSEK